MILTLSKKINDYKSLLIDVEAESVSNLEINFENALFVQENEMNEFFSYLSQFTNLEHLIMNFAEQSVMGNGFSQLIQSLQKLELISIKSKFKNTSVAEFNYFLSSIGKNTNVKNISFKVLNDCIQEEYEDIFKYLGYSQSLKNLTFELLCQNQKMNLKLNNFLVDENVIQFISAILQYKKELEYFEFEFINSNFSSILLNQLLSSFHRHSNAQHLKFYISQDIVLKEFFSLFKYVKQITSLKRFEFQLRCDRQHYFSIEYQRIYRNNLDLFFRDDQINEKDASYISMYIKSLENLEKLQIGLDSSIQPSSFNNLFYFFKDHKSIKQFNLEFQNKKLTTEQCQAITQCLKQSKSLKKLEIRLWQTQSEKQVHEVLSYQLSQLENIVSLKYKVLFQKIDISTSFIDQIIKSKQLQELDIAFSYLEYDGDYQVKAQQLFSMPNLKKLRLEFKNDNGREVEFFKDLNSIKQTNLQELTISLNQYNIGDTIVKYETLGKCLSNQKFIQNLKIEIHQSSDFEFFKILIKELKSSTITQFTFDFYHSHRSWFEEKLDELYKYTKRTMKRVVKLKFT